MWQFLKGYVIIQIEGLCTARFLKRIADAGIRIADVRKIGETTVRFGIPCKRFFALHRLRKGLPLRIRIVSRKGLPFLAQRLRRRPVLWIGAPLILIGMLLLSVRIWVIRIDETERVDPEEVRRLLEEDGICPGVRPHGPVLIYTANDLSARIRDAAWIGLDREGVMLRVRIVESLPESPKRSNTVPSDIVARKDGVITSITVMRGQARVKVGDRVKAGDVLISGTIVYKDASVETSADGVVRAAIDYRTETDTVDTVTESAETGSTETVRTLKGFGFELLRSRPTFEHYRLTDRTELALSSLLPIVLETQTAHEIVFRERTLSEEEAAEYALAKAREQAYALVPRDAQIINTYGTIRKRKGRQTAVVIVTAEEIIGKTEEAPHDG